MTMDSDHIASNFFLVLLVVSAAIVGFVFLPYLNALTIAVVFAILFHPVYKKLSGLVPHHESAAAFVSVILALVVVIIPLTFLGIVVFNEAKNVYADVVSGNGSQIADLVRGQLSGISPSLASLNFSQYAKSFLDWLIGNAGLIVSQLAAITITFFLSAFTLFYFLKDANKIRDAIVRISPLRHDDTAKILDKLGRMAGSVIKGSLVVSVLQGIVVGLGFYLFGLQNPVLWGSISVLCALVPIIGVAIVVIPAAIVVWLSGNAVTALGFAIWGLLLPGLVDNLLRPRLIDRDTNVNQLLVLFSVIGGISVFGPLGFILGPLALSLLLTLIEIYPSIFATDRKNPQG